MEGPSAIPRVGTVRTDLRRAGADERGAKPFHLDAESEPDHDDEKGRADHADEPLGPPDDDEAGRRIDVTA